MNLKLDESLSVNYKSSAQKIRVMSERWLTQNLFCPCCGNAHIEKMRNNSPVADVHCEHCGEIFELKSKKNLIGAKITDGAYRTMIERITSNINPQLFIMQYSSALCVTELTLVPKFFFTPDIIEKRKPLSNTARRAGWVGCNILYQKIPTQGKIAVIHSGETVAIKEVLRCYEKIKNLQTNNLSLRGWMMDILNCVNDIGSEIFTSEEIYKYAGILKAKHNLNNNIEAKIRQQLQFLRDRGFIEFVSRGVYRKVV